MREETIGKREAVGTNSKLLLQPQPILPQTKLVKLMVLGPPCSEREFSPIEVKQRVRIKLRASARASKREPKQREKTYNLSIPRRVLRRELRAKLC